MFHTCELSLQRQVSRIYASRFGIDRDADWFMLKLQEEVGERTQAHLMRRASARTRGMSDVEIDARFGQELADVLRHVLLLARNVKVDLEAEVEDKWLTRLSTPSAARS